MFSPLKRLLTPPDLGDPDRNRAARTQHWVLLVVASVSILLLAVTPLIPSTPPQSMISYVVGALLSIACLMLLRSGRSRLSGSLFSVGIWSIGALAMVFYGPESVALLLLVLAIVAAGFFWSPRAANGVAVASILWFGVLVLVRAGGDLPEPIAVPALRLWISVSVVLATTAAILQLGFWGMKHALEEARRAALDARASQSALAESERQLEEARRLEALGRLAGGVAHDFNNLLTIILSNSQAARKTNGAPHHDKLLTEIEQAGKRASKLTSQLLAFGGRQVLAAQPLDLSNVVGELEPLLRRLLPESVALELVLSEDLPPARADVSQLGQVVLNLAANARDAMPGGGKVIIQTCVFDAQSPGSPLSAAARRHVALIVTDDGEGMDENTRRSVFEPFFTTKSMGRGTGLGLATVHGIVSQSDGHVWAESEPEQGSRFVVILPTCDEPVGGVSDVEEAPLRSPAMLGGVVLLVEDEQSVRKVIQRMLEHAGLEVVSASSPEEALALEDLERIDLLISDVVMPGMMGTELATAIRSLRPELPVVLVSGYSQDALEEAPTGQGTFFLRKPLGQELLIATLRTALEERT